MQGWQLAPVLELLLSEFILSDIVLDVHHFLALFHHVFVLVHHDAVVVHIVVVRVHHVVILIQHVVVLLHHVVVLLLPDVIFTVNPIGDKGRQSVPHEQPVGVKSAACAAHPLAPVHHCG
jgi:hypothetical protein